MVNHSKPLSTSDRAICRNGAARLPSNRAKLPAGCSPSGRNRRAPRKPAGLPRAANRPRRSSLAEVRFQRKNGFRPLVEPFLAVCSNVLRADISAVSAGTARNFTKVSPRLACLVDREDEHLHRQIFLKSCREHKVDPFLCQVAVLGAFQDPDELDLAEAGLRRTTASVGGSLSSVSA